tara:strand:+ start:17210 stop:17500 length:291 start_codon:yes stop_codon:yes gene_type:complete
MTSSKLEDLKASIEKMSLSQQKEVLVLLYKKGHVSISENQNGSFINLSCLRPSDIAGLNQFVAYVQAQQDTLARGEKHKDELRHEYFNGDKAMSFN